MRKAIIDNLREMCMLTERGDRRRGIVVAGTKEWPDVRRHDHPWVDFPRMYPKAPVTVSDEECPDDDG